MEINNDNNNFSKKVKLKGGNSTITNGSNNAISSNNSIINDIPKINL